MILFFYNIFSSIVLLFLAIYTFGLKIFKQDLKYAEFKQRVGLFDKKFLDEMNSKKIIWVHASSLGELTTVTELLKELKNDEFAEYKILLSTKSITGQNLARKKNLADYYIYLPVDNVVTYKKLLNKVNPKCVIISETELWPNFILTAVKSNIKLFLFSGTISEKSYKLYKKYFSKYINKMLNSFELLLMQSKDDYERAEKLGAEKKKLVLTGDTKFDIYKKTNKEEQIKLKDIYKFSDDEIVFVAGSTHSNEEEQILKMFSELNNENLTLVIAPRHLERIPEVVKFLKQLNIRYITRTEIEKRNSEKVIILDTIGELSKLYSIADFAFVGGSLIPEGGHNILEPIVQGKYVLYGPHIFRVKESVEICERYEAGKQVENINELKNIVVEIIENIDYYREKGKLAEEAIDERKGATYKNLEHIKEYL